MASLTPARPDPSVVTELLEVLLDRDDRGQGVDREQLAQALGEEPDTLARAVEHLVDEAAVVVDGGALRLTTPGRELAVRIVRRHRLAERLLLDVIGLEWWKVHHEAERWETVISDEVETRLVELLGDPGTCPHGNPIPGSVNRPDQAAAIRLEDAPAGPVRVVRISEELEGDDEALRLLQGCGFLPGQYAEVQGPVSDGGMAVAGTIRDGVLPPKVAHHTFVLPN